MESFSAGGPSWQVLKVSDRHDGGGCSTLAGQNIELMGMSVGLNVDILAILILHRALFMSSVHREWVRTHSLDCQHEL